MKICITGGAGFIGSEMVRQLVRTGHQVYVIDSLTYAGNLKTLSSIEDRIQFSRIDIRDGSKIKRYLSEVQVDAVVNFAAETHVDNSIQSPGVFLETNILGTFNLLEASRVEGFRFLQVSTDEVYGSIREGEFSEDAKLDPSSPYSASKASAEMIMQSYIKTYSVEALGVRCSNNYGYFQHPEKLIPAFIKRMLEGKRLPVYGTGENVREWIHVSDSVAGITKVLENGTVGEFYNISSGHFRSNIAVTQAILCFFCKGNEFIEFVEDRRGHDFRYAINSSKIRKEMNWEPLIDFDRGLEDTIKWYLSNPELLELGKK